MTGMKVIKTWCSPSHSVLGSNVGGALTTLLDRRVIGVPVRVGEEP